MNQRKTYAGAWFAECRGAIGKRSRKNCRRTGGGKKIREVGRRRLPRQRMVQYAEEHGGEENWEDRVSHAIRG